MFAGIFAGMLAVFLTTTHFHRHPEAPDVCLADAYEFGVTHKIAHEEWMTARRHYTHHEKHVLETCQFTTYMDWVEEVNFRTSAWDLLDDSLNPSWTIQARLRKLNLLRNLIGIEEYTKRKMPACCPGHMFVD